VTAQPEVVIRTTAAMAAASVVRMFMAILR